MNTSNQRRVRPLYAWEIGEAHAVFGDQLRYDRVRVHECAAWPDSVDRLGRRLKGMPPLEEGGHNAITLGYNTFFPVQLPEALVPPGQPGDWAMGWLIHELTHAWQFQRRGWVYLALTLTAQMREGAKVYDFGGPEALCTRRQDGWTLDKFNYEQQGEITRGYYNLWRRGEEVSAWFPYIQDIQGESK